MAGIDETIGRVKLAIELGHENVSVNAKELLAILDDLREFAIDRPRYNISTAFADETKRILEKH